MDVPTPNLVELAKQSNKGGIEYTETKIIADGTEITAPDSTAPRNRTAKMTPRLPEPPALFLTTRPGNEGFAPKVDPPSPQIESSSQTAEAGTITDGPVDDKTGGSVDNINDGTTGNEDDRQTTNPMNDGTAVIDEETDAVNPLAAATEDAGHISQENVMQATHEDSPPIVEIKIPSLSQHTSSEDLRLSNPYGQETPRKPCPNQTIVRDQTIKCVSHGIQGMHNDESSEEESMINANQAK